MTDHRILVVDEKPMFDALARLGRSVRVATTWTWHHCDTPTTALTLLRNEPFSLVLTDCRIEGRDMSGLELVLAIRRSPSTIPIIVYTSVALDEIVRARVLEIGADDVVLTPLDIPSEFLARCHALLRRSSGSIRAAPLSIGNLRVDLACRAVFAGEAPIALTRDQSALMNVFAACTPRAVSYGDLAQVLGYARAHDRKAVNEAVRRLRGRLQDSGADVLIEPVAGFGYRLVTARETLRIDRTGH